MYHVTLSMYHRMYHRMHRSVCTGRAQSPAMWDLMTVQLGKVWGDKDKAMNSLWNEHFVAPWSAWYVNCHPSVPLAYCNNNVIEVSQHVSACISTNGANQSTFQNVVIPVSRTCITTGITVRS